MTPEEYLEINAKGFEGDSFLKKEFEKIISENEIEVVVETGTFRGATTKHFSEMVKDVYSIEVNEENYFEATKNLMGISNVHLFYGSSEKVLPKILPHLKNFKSLLFLDAHWEAYNPLRDELKAILDSGLKPCIAIHDFKVPEKDFGYDSYNGQDYCLSWIEDLLIQIYGEGFKYHYNQEAEGAKRGVIFINC